MEFAYSPCAIKYSPGVKVDTKVFCVYSVIVVSPYLSTLSGRRGAILDIRWQSVVHRVKSLQSRIVKAVKAKRWNLVKKLQGLLAHSFASKLLAIRRITENSGKRTAGIDGQIYKFIKINRWLLR